MKKAIALILLLLCAFIFVGCGAEKLNGKTEVYTFSGENDYFSVSNGTVVLDGEEEAFSGGHLTVLQKQLFSDIVSYDADFYIIKDGNDKRAVLSSSVVDMTGGSVRFNGDDLGKISGDTIITNYKMIEEEEWQNNLFFELTLKDSKGREKVYEIQMNVEKVY